MGYALLFGGASQRSTRASNFACPEVGDLFMSLIHTCQLCGANSFDYLTELQRHAQELVDNPTDWMPWNYRQAVERAGV